MHQQYSWKNVHCYAGVVCIHVQKWAQGHNNYGSPTFGDFLYITEVALHIIMAMTLSYVGFCLTFWFECNQNQTLNFDLMNGLKQCVMFLLLYNNVSMSPSMLYTKVKVYSLKC